jgi:hypothetical protein
LRLAPSKGPNKVDVFLLSPEDGKRSSFRNVVSSSIYNSGQCTKSKNPAILSLILHILKAQEACSPSTFVSAGEFAVTEHSFESSHHVLFQETEVLTKMQDCMGRSLEEEREVKLYIS